MKPLLKWVGGKTQILEDVLATFPDYTGTYREPFVGGGSVLLGMLERGANRVVASDLNPDLIHFYQSIQSDPEGFIAQTNDLLASVGVLEDDYYTQRTLFNDRTVPRSASRFWFINKTCFRGLYRTGPNGYNVPFGHGTLPKLDPDHVRAVSALIQPVVFRCCSYTEALGEARPGDLVYMDPPYVPLTATSFVGYTTEGFSSDDHMRLFDTCKHLPCAWVMSNSDTPLVRSALSGCTFSSVSVRRAIHSKNPGSRTTELLCKSN